MVPATFRKQSVCKVAPNADKEFHGLYLIGDMRCKCLGLVLTLSGLLRGDGAEFNAGGCYCLLAITSTSVSV